jgi:release factor glutamine methyltransferase
MNGNPSVQQDIRLIRLPGVFRPRSDSWMLAEHVRRIVRPGDDVLELCSGTGLTAIAAARAGAREVTALDVSRRAVATARLNGLVNRCLVSGKRGDLYAAVAGRRFDVIAANPPYVPTEDQREPPGGGPRRALDAGIDGRALIERIVAAAPEHLRPGGRLVMVHSSVCGIDATLASMRARGLDPDVLERREGPLGPVVLARAPALEANGVLAPGQRTEELAVIAGLRA